jgi:CheY-like chemotaxis protein
VEFLRGADLVIHDAQYTEAEYLTKRNWGHSTGEYAVDVCAAAGVRQVALTHHDPDRDDDAVERIEALCQERAHRMGSPLEVVAAAEGMEILLPERAEPAPSGVLETNAVDRLQPACILVVDDDPDMLDLVGAVLARDGYQLLTAEDGQQALEAVERRRPDLVILDVMMPRMNGYQVLKQLRANPEFRDVPVLMFTARAGEEDIVRSFAGGVTDYVSKPVTPSLLRARVRRWLLGPEQRG